MHEVLVNSLRGLNLPWKSVVWLHVADRPDNRFYCGCKTTTTTTNLTLYLYNFYGNIVRSCHEFVNIPDITKLMQ